jgi:hypothetical protein
MACLLRVGIIDIKTTSTGALELTRLPVKSNHKCTRDGHIQTPQKDMQNHAKQDILNLAAGQVSKAGTSTISEC